MMSFDLKIENGDIKIDPSGKLTIVFDNEKLKQDIIKLLLTKKGDNKYHYNYGSDVGALKVGTVLDDELLKLDLTSSTEDAIKNLMSMQKIQSKRQVLSAGEVIVDILNIAVERDVADPRMFNIFISVLTQKLTTISESVSIKII